MKKLKTTFICQFAIFMSALAILISIVASYWVYKENEYQLFKFRMEMQAEKNASWMREHEDLIMQMNELYELSEYNKNKRKYSKFY